MIRVRANQTVADSFGVLPQGHEKDIDASLAKELEKLGLVKILSEDDGQPVPERKSKGVTFKDATEKRDGDPVFHKEKQEEVKKVEVAEPEKPAVIETPKEKVEGPAENKSKKKK